MLNHRILIKMHKIQNQKVQILSKVWIKIKNNHKFPQKLANNSKKLEISQHIRIIR